MGTRGGPAPHVVGAGRDRGRDSGTARLDRSRIVVGPQGETGAGTVTVRSPEQRRQFGIAHPVADPEPDRVADAGDGVRARPAWRHGR